MSKNRVRCEKHHQKGKFRYVTTLPIYFIAHACVERFSTKLSDDVDNDGNVFVYRGGRAPRHVTRVRIHKSVDEIEDEAFSQCKGLVKVEFHDGIRNVGKRAFLCCRSLPKINLKSIIRIGHKAFFGCVNLADVEFGDVLEIIGAGAFESCISLKHLKLPSTVTIEGRVFNGCTRLIDIEFSERLEIIGPCAFWGSEQLQRITIPLKRDLFPFDVLWQKYAQFDDCEQLVRVELIGADVIHKTVASLHMESWRTDMISEINRINVYLPSTPADEKTNVIREWMESVLDKMVHYKAWHYRYVKEGVTLLELALWKAKLGEKEENFEERRTKKARVDTVSARKERRVTCGADIVIKTVLPFLQLECV